MTTTSSQLLTPPTKDEIVQLVIDELASLGYPADAWQVGSVHRNLIEAFSKMYEQSGYALLDLAAARYNDTATGPYLTKLSKSHFNHDRKLATPTRGYLRLTSAATAPSAYTIDMGANQIIVKDAIHGYTYRNVTGGTLNIGSTLDVEILAETPASNRDVAHDTITTMVTGLAGVTCNNPVRDSGSWIIINGSDIERDVALRERNRLKVTTFAISAPPAKAYEYHALNGSTSVTRAFCDDSNPRGTNTFDLYVAGASGPVSTTVLTQVDDYIRGNTDGVGRLGINANMLVKTASSAPVPIGGQIYIASSKNTTENQNAISTRVIEIFQDLPIGGLLLPGFEAGVVPYGATLQAISDNGKAGIYSVSLVGFSADIPLTKSQVAVPSFTGFTFVSVKDI